MVVPVLVLRACRKRSFSYFAVSEGRSGHGAVSMIHGHDSLYYHGIEEGSHKRQSLQSRRGSDEESSGRVTLARRITASIGFLRSRHFHVSVIPFRFARVSSHFPDHQIRSHNSQTAIVQASKNYTNIIQIARDTSCVLIKSPEVHVSEVSDK